MSQEYKDRMAEKANEDQRLIKLQEKNLALLAEANKQQAFEDIREAHEEVIRTKDEKDLKLFMCALQTNKSQLSDVQFAAHFREFERLSKEVSSKLVAPVAPVAPAKRSFMPSFRGMSLFRKKTGGTRRKKRKRKTRR